MLLVPGARLDRYELLCPVAQGGMAAVWLARVRGTVAGAQFEKRFALKVILPQHAHDRRFQQMFLAEASIAARLVHTNVAQIVDLGEAQGILYIAMEWVEGDTLVRLAKAIRAAGQRFPSGIAMRVIGDVASGLHGAHEMRDDKGQVLGVVHRDVSPHNVMVSTQGAAKLIDFGIAKAQGLDAAEQTSSGTLKGKVIFMAPEQAAASAAVDRRADVWALGATLFYLLAGAGPFEGVNEAASLQRLLAGGPRSALPKGTPEVVRWIVDRALVHDPAQRAQTAAEIHEAILTAGARDPTLTATDAEVAQFLQLHLGRRLMDRAATHAQAIARLDEAEWVETTVSDVAAASAAAASAAAPPAPAPASASSGPSAEEGATLGAAALEAAAAEAAADARKARARVAIASVAGAAIVAAAVGVVAVWKMDAAGGKGQVVSVGAGVPSGAAPAAPVSVSAGAGPATPTAPASATVAATVSAATTVTPRSVPARTVAPTPSAAAAPPPMPAVPATTTHRDYGF